MFFHEKYGLSHTSIHSRLGSQKPHTSQEVSTRLLVPKLYSSRDLLLSPDQLFHHISLHLTRILFIACKLQKFPTSF